MTNEPSINDERLIKFLHSIKEGVNETPQFFKLPKSDLDFVKELENLADLLLSDKAYRAAFLSLCMTFAIRDVTFQKLLLFAMLENRQMTDMFTLMDKIQERNKNG